MGLASLSDKTCLRSLDIAALPFGHLLRHLSYARSTQISNPGYLQPKYGVAVHEIGYHGLIHLLRRQTRGVKESPLWRFRPSLNTVMSRVGGVMLIFLPQLIPAKPGDSA